ncbi:hypothetical protein M408DRAFT_27103 [Serendipita vermifera MAFF 305830]|uniref:Uncharacterized protein n=1 Tax=Serendipita vermifera MAFF 305830 TaxID=933852 RepID=A0A0C3AYV4_SERVB|nr:hypothetical protein M408DRAFT_27103 [Serendipita vermifera MAFF 305830]
MSHNLRGEIIQTKEKLRVIKERENNATLELESIRSERQALEGFASILEDQHQALQSNIRRFAGLLHPINRCPEDILRIVFQCLVLAEHENWCKASIKVSHVCRQWRAITINTPELWDSIIVPKAHHIPRRLSLLNMVFSRLRSVAPQIMVFMLETKAKDAAKHLSLLLKSSNMNQGNRIKLLQLSLPSSSMSNFIDFNTPFLKSIDSFRIVAEKSLKAPTALHLTKFFDYFPLIDELRINNVPQIMIEEEQVSNTVTSLKFQGARVIPSFASLAWFKNLASLDMAGTTFQDDMLETDINLGKLQDIRVHKSDGIPWTRLQTPQLTRVEFFSSSAFSEDVLGFLRRNQQICHFGFAVVKRNLKSIPLALPGLVTLEIMGPCRWLYERSATGLENLPFRELRHLVIITNKRIDDLEALVAARCHLTLASGPLPVALKSLTIRHPGSDVSEACPQMHSWLGRCTITRRCSPEPRHEDWHDCTLTWMHDEGGAGLQ